MESSSEIHIADEKRRKLCMVAVYAEAFFVALSPWAATLALALGVLLWLYRFVKNPERKFERTKVDKFILVFLSLVDFQFSGQWIHTLAFTIGIIW